MRRSTVAMVVAIALVAACSSGDVESSPSVVTSASTNVAPPTGPPAEPTAQITEGIERNGAELSEPGPFGVGRLNFETTDPDRDDRLVRILVFYPATTDSARPAAEAGPDLTGAPYPVVVGDGDIGTTMGPHLASHGFVFAAVIGQSTWGLAFNAKMIDYPLDHMVALNTLETLSDPILTGIADTSRAGTIGYSYGGWDALSLTGARIDPDHYEQTCSSRPVAWSDNWWNYVCGSPERWQQVVARAEEVGVATPDGLWEPMGDERIKAAMPMGAEGFDMTGPAGLEDARAAVLLIGAGADDINDFVPATTQLFEHYPESELITFVDAGHLMIFESDAVAQMRRFAVAFFGLHLSGDDAYAPYLTKEYVEEVAPGLGPAESFETLVWGIPGS